MKKKWLLLAGSMMIAATMGFAVACSEETTETAETAWSRGAKDVSKLAISVTETTTVSEVDFPEDYMAEYDYSNYEPIKDNSGLFLVYKENYDSYTSEYTYEYRLFDWTTGELSSVRKTLTSQERNDATYGFLGDGVFYVGMYDEETDERNYTVYTRDGENYRENYIGVAERSGSTLALENGTRYYVTPNGEFVEETDEFARFLDNADAQDAYSVGDYYVEVSSGDVVHIYDESGAYVKTVDLAREWDVTSNGFVTIETAFAIENRLIVQYVEELPDDTTEYDMFDDGIKANISTLYYDLDTGKSGEWENFNFIINNSMYMLKFAELNVNEIVDGFISEAESTITVDKDGKGYVDLDAIVANTTFAVPDEYGFVVLRAYDTNYYYKGKKLVLQTTGYADLYETVLVVEGISKLYVYDLNGNLIETISGVVDYEDTADGNFCYQTENGLYTYDVKAKQSSLLISLNDSMEVDIRSDCVIIEDEGLNEDYYLDSDDYVSVYFFNSEMEDILRINGAVNIDTIEIANYENGYMEVLLVEIEYYGGSDATIYYLITETYEIR